MNPSQYNGCAPQSAYQVVSPFYGQQGSVVRRLSGVGQYDAVARSFADSVEKVRLYDQSGLHSGFVDIAGNNAISAFEQYQQPPQSWFHPTPYVPACRGGESGLFGLKGAAEDDLNENLYGLYARTNADCQQYGKATRQGYCACPMGTSGARCQFPGLHPRRANYLMHGMAT